MDCYQNVQKKLLKLNKQPSYNKSQRPEQISNQRSSTDGK